MKIKEIKCPNCNANISIKNNETKGTCEYCKSEIIIDDGTIIVEHVGTIEITDDTSLKIANTTLNKFKDYDKSLLLYKRLMYKYAHKKDIYIGLVRSITKDFKINNISNYQLKEVNEYWEKYTTLAEEKEIGKYTNLVKDLNKNYWYSTLINITNNFNASIKSEKINIIEETYNNYIKYCDKKEKNNIDFKYQGYLRDYKQFINQRNRNTKTIIKGIIGIIITILLIIGIFLLTENTKKMTDSIKLSEINEHYYQIKNDYQFFKQYFKSTKSDMTITDIKLNNEDKSVNITVSLKNILIEKNKTFKFSVIDDTGPIITPKSCEFTDTDIVNVYDCFTLYDFTDGVIDSKKAEINTEGIDFKSDGIKAIKIKAIDRDGNKNELDVNITITKTPIQLEFKLDDKIIVGNTYTISSKITPNNIKDTTISYTYDEKFVKISNNKITALKKGQTEICAVSNYNNDVKQCRNINLELQCKDTYIFNFDGSKSEIITSDENFCPGTYKIYASVMNKNNFYHLKINPKDSFLGETLTIYKNSSFLNDEGSKYVLTEGYTISTEIGITQVKLIKQK